MQPEGKRGSARGGRGRGRGAGRGKRGRRVVSSDEESVDTRPQDDTAPLAASISTELSTPVAEAKAPESVPMEISAAATEPEQPLAAIENVAPTIDIEADISQLEAPTFTTITRGPPEPMLRLKWNHKVLLIGEKVINPMIHSCDTCLLPILHYGRMIPCKHVFCLMCAKREPVKECPRCKDKVCRVEQSGLGTVFMCTHGGSRYNNKGCRRTYLSQRDLQAHINHRHVAVAVPPKAPGATDSNAADNNNKSAVNSSTAAGRKSLGNTTPNAASNAQQQQQQPMSSSVRTNLMNMQQENLNDDNNSHYSRHSSNRYSHNMNSNAHYDNSSGGGNWSSNNNNNYR